MVNLKNMSAPTNLTIRPFRPGDHLPLVALWNRCLHKDPITPERFWQLFLLDENFDPDGALIVENGDGAMIGFLQAMVRKVPYGNAALQPEQGWFTVFFVDHAHRRQGVGTALLTRGMAFLRQKGCRQVGCSGYSPYYIFPGVDEDYGAARAFLSARGFTPSAPAVAMGLPLEGVSTPPAIIERRATLAAEEIVVRPFERADTLPLFDFADAHYLHWTPSLRDSLQRANTDILVTVRGPQEQTEILAYAQWQNPHNDPPRGAPGRFGPFGVHPDWRGQGIGAVVFYAMIERALGNGSRYLWFGWAGGRNLSFYERAGCKVTRRFQLYQAML